MEGDNNHDIFYTKKSGMLPKIKRTQLLMAKIQDVENRRKALADKVQRQKQEDQRRYQQDMRNICDNSNWKRIKERGVEKEGRGATDHQHFERDLRKYDKQFEDG